MLQVGCYPGPGETPGGFTLFKFNLANSTGSWQRDIGDKVRLGNQSDYVRKRRLITVRPTHSPCKEFHE